MTVPRISDVSCMVPYKGVSIGLTTKRHHKSTTLSIYTHVAWPRQNIFYFCYFRNFEIQVEALASISGDLYVHVEAFASLPPSSYAPDQMSPKMAWHGTRHGFIVSSNITP